MAAGRARIGHWLVACRASVGWLALWLLLTPVAIGGAPALPAEQRIELHRVAGPPGEALVSLGIPLPPGALRDPALLRIVDARGREQPAAVVPTLYWHFRDGSLRALRVQLRVEVGTQPAIYYFLLGQPRQRTLPAWPYAQGLQPAAHQLQLPAVLATLTPAWLTASQIAGPQRPAGAGEPQAAYVAAQFRWAAALPVEDYTAWLFDRPSTLFKAYLRSGRLDYLQAAVESYHFYMASIRRQGSPHSPECGGGWSFSGKPCDVKYVYIEPILLALALTGDDSQHDRATVAKMADLWAAGGWSGTPGPYLGPGEHFTERLAGLGLLETVSAYELTGERRYLERVQQRLGWLAQHQRHNPDGLGDDGSWRSSWQRHEDDRWNPADDVRGSSPWMSENIIDGLWHAWLVTADPRIPPMVTGFGRYLERYGWIDPATLRSGHDWRNPCSGPAGQIAWYWASAQAGRAALETIQDSEGWYSDAHNVELMMPVALARYFEPDPAQATRYGRRLKALASSFDARCAVEARTLRRFNWNNRGSGVLAWLLAQPAGAGASAPMLVRAGIPGGGRKALFPTDHDGAEGTP